MGFSINLWMPRRSRSRFASRSGTLLGWAGIAALASMAAWLLSACAAFQTLDYYWQSAAGQWELLSRARSIHDVIAETDDDGLRIRLRADHRVLPSITAWRFSGRAGLGVLRTRTPWSW